MLEFGAVSIAHMLHLLEDIANQHDSSTGELNGAQQTWLDIAIRRAKEICAQGGA